MIIMRGISYRTVPNTIWLIFPEFFIFCQHILRAFRRVKLQQNMKNKENICHVLQCKRSIISLLLTYKIYTSVNLSFIKEENKKHIKINFLFQLLTKC